MAVMTTSNLDGLNNSNQFDSGLIADCLSRLKSLAFSQSVEYKKGTNNLAEDNHYSKNNSVELVESYGVNLKKYFNGQLTGCFDNLDSIIVYQMKALRNIYYFENPVKVFDYLQDKNDFVTFLLKAADKINEIFADEMEITLVKKSDPEIKNYHYLAAYINTSDLSVAEARAKLKKFKYEWYFEHSDDFEEGIVFHVT